MEAISAMAYSFPGGGNPSGTMAQINPFRYRGYYYDSETGFYYLQSRYYDPQIGRFINADQFASTGQDFIGYNMFAYCNNSPVTRFDPTGLWTISISGTISGVFGVGVAFSFGLAFDGQRNFDWQYSYAVPGINDTSMVGVVGVGAGVAVQYTKACTVYDLYGPATYVGASAGPGWYIGGDLVSFSDASDSKMPTDGFQIVAGVGIGLDVHVTESNTRPFPPKRISAQSGLMSVTRSRMPYMTMLN